MRARLPVSWHATATSHVAAEQRIDLAIFRPIIEEVTRTLREKFGRPEDRLDDARRNIGKITRHVLPARTVDVIVTGDNDLHRLGQFGDIRVMTVAGMLEVVQGSAD